MGECFWTDLVGVEQDVCGGIAPLVFLLGIYPSDAPFGPLRVGVPKADGCQDFESDANAENIQSWDTYYDEIQLTSVTCVSVDVYVSVSSMCSTRYRVACTGEETYYGGALDAFTTEVVLDGDMSYAGSASYIPPFITSDWGSPGDPLRWGVSAEHRELLRDDIDNLYPGSYPYALKFTLNTSAGQLIWWVVDTACV